MLRKASLSAAAAAALLLSVAAAQAAPGAGGSEALTPPVIHETFTPLPCSGRRGHRTTLQDEGCAEQRILRTDARLNRLASSIFSLLPGAPARRSFVRAQESWLAYRRADCLSMSDVFHGGTLAPLVDARCQAARNERRLSDLRAFLGSLRRGG